MKKLLLSLFLLAGVLPAVAQVPSVGYNNCALATASSCVLKTTSGRLVSVNAAISGGGAGYLILLDQTTAASGTIQANLVKVIPFTAGAIFQSFDAGAIVFNTGIVAACSNAFTVPNTITLANCFISGETQ